jgi:hypothetical protein
MAPLLIPEELRGRLSSAEHLSLVKKLEDALNEPESFPDDVESYDWRSVADRAEAILGQYGSCLPKV